MGCPSQTAVVGGRKWPWAAAYSLATAIPSAQAASCSDHTIPSFSSSATRPASSVPAAYVRRWSAIHCPSGYPPTPPQSSGVTAVYGTRSTVFPVSRSHRPAASIPRRQ